MESSDFEFRRNGIGMLLSAVERERQAAAFAIIGNKGFEDVENGDVRSTHLASDMVFANPHGFNLQPFASPLMLPFVPPTPRHLPHHPLQGMDPIKASSVFDLRCVACGMQCKTMAGLHTHIMTSHLANGISAAPESKPAEQVSTEPSRERSPSRTKASDERRPSRDFPIPTPNFAMLPNHRTSIPNGIRTEPSAVFPTAPPFAVSHPVNPPRFPQLPASYAGLNPFLTYPGLMAMNGMYPGVSLPLGVSPAIAASYNPYLGFPGAPAPTMLAGRLPYTPGIPLNVGLDTNSRESTPNRPNLNDVGTTTTSEQTNSYHRSLAAIGLNHRHTDAIKRRLSAPLIGLGKDFKFPHPYSRVGKNSASVGPSCGTVLEQVEPSNQESNAQRYAARRESITDKRDATDEKSAGSRINAKSIEQHISKIISNNEKVLLNPVLERVKPRRVFRRNSLDPASLSSYAASIAGRHANDAPFHNDDEKNIQKIYDVMQSGFGQGGFPTSPDSKVAGLSIAEYNKMIELTRAPRNNLGRKISHETPDPTPHTSHDYNPHSHRFLGKRNSVSGPTSSEPKKTKRTSFECSDCGARYRKEDNYMIHKQVYCNNKNSRSTPATQYDVPANKPINPMLINQSPLPLTTSIQSKSAIHITSSIPSNPLKFFHNELCRTKSADFALQSDKGHGGSDVTPDPAHAEAKFAVDRVEGTNSIPTNRLPPNKRHMHMMRHHDDVNSASDAKPDAPSPPRPKEPPPAPPKNPDPPSHDDEQFPPSPTTLPAELAVQRWQSNGDQPSASDLFRFAESSVPRSNYKLLLHQISLRNLQDMGLMGQSPTRSPHKDAASKQWMQAQSNQYANHLDKLRRSSVDVSPLAQHMRRSSLPVILPMYPGHGGSMSRSNANYSRFNPPNTDQAPNDRSCKRHPAKPADIESVHPKQPREAEVNTRKPLNRDEAIEGGPIDVNNNNPQLVGSLSPAPDARNEPSERVIISETMKGDDDSNVPKGEITHQGSPNPPTNEQNQKVDPKLRTHRLLYPHSQPSLACGVYSTYCSITSPQPAYMEVSKEGKSPLSMYSRWEVSKPILMPPDMTVGDILTCCRRSKSGYRRGIVVTAKGSDELIVTDTKKREKSAGSAAEKSAGSDSADDGSNVESVSVAPTFPTPGLIIPTSNIATRHIYTSCCRTASSMQRVSQDAPTQRKPDKIKDELDSESGYVDVVSLGENSPNDSTEVTSSSPATPHTRETTSPEDSSSPKAITAVHTLHTSKTPDHQLKWCSLCSIKAGRSDLVPGPACEPCQAATAPATTTTSPSTTLSNGYLDKTKALTGSTQHWLSNPPHGIFQYPSPTKVPTTEPGVEPGVAASNPSREIGRNDESLPRNGTGSPAESDSPVVVGPALAEVLSEVIRSAEIQSKSQNNSKKHRRSLSHSRPIHPDTSHEESADTNQRTNLCDATNRPYVTDGVTNRPYVTDDVTSESSQPPDTEVKLSAKLHRRHLALSTRESELFLNKANLLHADDMEPTTLKGRNHVNSDQSLVNPRSDDADTSQPDDVDSCSDVDDHVTDLDDQLRPCDVAARPYKCSECKVAFRISGHLAKHLRSKGHKIAMQKKTLNRLKMQSLGVSNAGNPHDERHDVSDSPTPTAVQESSEFLDGTEGLARSQVRALFQGSDEYASIPHGGHYDDIYTSDAGDEPHVARPFKCLACRVAFRFQGHLDRHFRSNLHIIAVGHYGSDGDIDSNIVTSSSVLPRQVSSSLSSDVMNNESSESCNGMSFEKSPQFCGETRTATPPDITLSPDPRADLSKCRHDGEDRHKPPQIAPCSCT